MTPTTLDLLTEHPFLARLALPSLQRLSPHGHPAYRHGGQRLFHEGQPADRFWLLCYGRVALDLHVAGRGEVVIETIGAGDVVGWSWLFPPYRWQSGAITAEPVQAVEFDAAGVRQLMADDIELARDLDRRFMVVMLDRLQAARRRLVERYGSPATWA